MSGSLICDLFESTIPLAMASFNVICSFVVGSVTRPVTVLYRPASTASTRPRLGGSTTGFSLSTIKCCAIASFRESFFPDIESFNIPVFSSRMSVSMAPTSGILSPVCGSVTTDFIGSNKPASRA